MAQNMNIINQVGTITDPLAVTMGDAQNVPATYGKRGEQIANELNGRYHVANYRNHLFTATAAAVTLPVVASGVASVFSLMNPANSGKYLDLCLAEVGTVLATTVVDLCGIYFLNSPVNASTTVGTIKGCIAGGGAPSVAIFYTANTHTAQTPTLQSLIGGWGAVTDSSLNMVSKDFNGTVLVPPGTCIDLLMTTAASTASGITAALTWMEYPI
jgi:hypothetical protein